MRIILSIIFLITSLININLSAQEKDISDGNQKNTVWSVSVAYSPRYSFELDHFKLQNTLFLSGINFTLDRRVITESVSFSLGTTWYHRSLETYYPNKNEIITLMKFPLQVNYHFKRITNKLDPYLKGSFMISYLKYTYTESVWPGNPGILKAVDYSLFTEFGFGSSMRISKDLSLVLEVSIGYGIVYQLHDRTYIDCQAGIKYSF
jgi:hypothetical protein